MKYKNNILSVLICVDNGKMKKDVTNEKEKINRLCNKCEKQTLIFFDNLGNREKIIKNKMNLIKELEKLEAFESCKVVFI